MVTVIGSVAVVVVAAVVVVVVVVVKLNVENINDLDAINE